MGGFATHRPIPTEGLEILLDIGNNRAYSGTGTTIDDISGNGWTATMNGAFYDTTNHGTINCDGINDSITIPNDVSFNDFSTRVSVSCWFMPRFTTSTFVGLVSKDNTQAGGGGFGAFQLGSNSTNTNMRWGFKDSTNTTQHEISITTNALLNYNVWSHFVGTWGNGILKLYENGKLVATSSFISDTPYQNTEPIRIAGRNLNNIYHFAGLMGHVAIYKSTLDQNGVTALYEAFKDRFS